MMSYVYAVTDRPKEPLPQQLGLDDEELARVVFRDIGAVVSAHAGSDVSAAADKVWRHEQVVESLMSAHAVLPMRFGTLLASWDEVEGMLRRGYPKFVEDIARVRDHVEVGIRFMALREPWDAQASPAAADRTRRAERSRPVGNSPRNGLPADEAAPGEHERRDRHQAELELVRKTYRIRAEHAAASRLDEDTVDAPTVSAAFLHPGALASFRQLVGRLAAADRDLALLCTGPWPAYSFVSAHPSKSTQRAGS